MGLRCRRDRPPELARERPYDPAKRQTLKKLAGVGLLALGGGMGVEGCVRTVVTTPSDSPRPTLPGAAKGSNLVICVLDAARAHHFGCYSYPRPTTPNIDALARESFVFLRHFCQHTSTTASTNSLFTGQYPDTHCAYGYRPLPDSAFRIDQCFADAGFRTAMFSSNICASPETTRNLAFNDSYSPHQGIEDVVREGETPHSPGPLLRVLEEWLEGHSAEQFCAYVHLIPPHKPYDQPEEFTAGFRGEIPPGYSPEKYRPGDWEFPIARKLRTDVPPLPEWINLYDAHLSYGDWATGQIVGMLQQRGIFDNTLLIVTADHGEAFGEHGFILHSPAIHDEVSRVPLVMRLPGGAPAGRIEALTQTIDLLPTLCDLYGIEYPRDRVQGRSAVPLLAREADTLHDYVFTHAESDRYKYLIRGLSSALILYGNGVWRQLYDMESDPEQRRNIIAEEPERAVPLVEAFEAFSASQRRDLGHFLDPSKNPEKLPGREVPELTPKFKKELKALGYL